MSREKHVFSTHEIPHLWLHQTQADGRNAAGNLFFRDGTIYSYGSHFPIARRYTSKSGGCVLFTTASYSVTTARHIGHVRQAIPASVPVFNVPNVTWSGSDSSSAQDKENHAANLADYVKRIESAIIKSARARSSWQKESSHDGAVAMSADARAYAKFFRVRCPKLPAVPALDSEAMDTVRKAEAGKAAKRADETRRKNEEYAVRQSENAAKWRKGEYNGSFDYGFPTMLRLVSTDGHCEVETSRGARVPVAHAKRALQFVREVKASGQEWRSNGHTFHIGNYSVDRISADGTLFAGCHVIEYAETERIAPALESLNA